jgi:hypothetical protein
LKDTLLLEALNQPASILNGLSGLLICANETLGIDGSIGSREGNLGLFDKLAGLIVRDNLLSDLNSTSFTICSSRLLCCDLLLSESLRLSASRARCRRFFSCGAVI